VTAGSRKHHAGRKPRTYLPIRVLLYRPDVGIGALTDVPVDQRFVQRWYDHGEIDVEAVHGMATRTQINYVGAKSCLNADLYNADDYVVTHHLDDIVTNSWLDPAGDVLDSSSDRAAYDQLFLEAASQGIGFQYSSGDDGDNLLNHRSPHLHSSIGQFARADIGLMVYRNQF